MITPNTISNTGRNNLHDALKSVRPYRNKRSLDHGLFPFIGWIQQKFIGVATTHDLDDLKINSQRLTDYIQELRDILKDHSGVLAKLIGDMKVINSTFTQYHKYVNDQLSKVNDFQKSITSSINQNFEEVQKTLSSVTHAISDIHVMVEYYKELQFFEIAFSMCSDERIPHDLINSTTLRLTLKDVQDHLVLTPFELSIPIDMLDWYYEFKLAYCTENNHDLDVVVAIPIKQKKLNQVLEVAIPIPIRVENKSYVLDFKKPTYILYNQNHMVELNEFLTDCLIQRAPILNNCLIRPVNHDPIALDSCLARIRFGTTIKAYKENCKLTSVTSHQQEWHQLNSTHWLYTGGRKTIHLKGFGNDTS